MVVVEEQKEDERSQHAFRVTKLERESKLTIQSVHRSQSRSLLQDHGLKEVGVSREMVLSSEIDLVGTLFEELGRRDEKRAQTMKVSDLVHSLSLARVESNRRRKWFEEWCWTHSKDLRQLRIEVLLPHALSIENRSPERVRSMRHPLTNVVLLFLHLRATKHYVE